MKHKRLITAIAVPALIIIAAVIAAICFINYDMSTEKMTVDLYFMNEDGTGIVSEPHDIRYRDSNELIQNTIKKLMAGPSSSKRGDVIPDGTDVQSLRAGTDASLIIDFSGEFITEDKSKNVLDTYAVVKTLCSTGYVAVVKITVNGAPVTDRDGNELGFISASDINLETETYSSEMRDITLYFADSGGKGLVKENRTIKITDQQPVEQYIINELIKGPGNGSLEPLLSDDTILVSVDIEDNICYLNFKSSFIKANTGSSDHEKLVIYSIVNSLTEIPTISRVQFYMDGKRVENFGTVPIKDCISRNTDIIDDK